MQKEIEVMQVLRLPPMGKLVVSVKKERYEKIADIEQGNVKRLLLAAIGELIDFAGGYQELVNAGVAPNIGVASNIGMATNPPQTSVETSTQTAILQEQRNQFLSKLEAERDAIRATPPPKPKFPIMSGLRPTIPQTKMSNLVTQIDDILQTHLAQHPEFAKQSIHLLQSPAGGLQIEVDGVLYQKPREVNDKKIQLLIKRALKEWEAL